MGRQLGPKLQPGRFTSKRHSRYFPGNFFLSSGSAWTTFAKGPSSELTRNRAETPRLALCLFNLTRLGLVELWWLGRCHCTLGAALNLLGSEQKTQLSSSSFWLILAGLASIHLQLGQARSAFQSSAVTAIKTEPSVTWRQSVPMIEPRPAGLEVICLSR